MTVKAIMLHLCASHRFQRRPLTNPVIRNEQMFAVNISKNYKSSQDKQDDELNQEYANKIVQNLSHIIFPKPLYTSACPVGEDSKYPRYVVQQLKIYTDTPEFSIKKVTCVDEILFPFEVVFCQLYL